jgi:hypothetical protein
MTFLAHLTGADVGLVAALFLAAALLTLWGVQRAERERE